MIPIHNNYRLKSLFFIQNFKFCLKRSINISSKNLEPNDTIKIKFDTGQLELRKGYLARLADSSTIAKFNDTNVLVTIVNKQKTQPASFLPLTVDYLHKSSAAGKIPSNFLRRDLGASNYEVLVARMIDRSIRPLFSTSLFSTETQIVCNLLSFNGQDNPDVLCINATSFALNESNKNWNGPIGCVRVGMINEKFIVNPTKKQLEFSPLNLVLTIGANKNITMIEAWGEDLEQNKFLDAIEFACLEAYKIVELLKSSKETNKFDDFTKTQNSNVTDLNENQNKIEKEKDDIFENFQTTSYSALYEIFSDDKHDKKSRDASISRIKNSVVNNLLKSESLNKIDPFVKNFIYNYQYLSELFGKFCKNIIRDLILEESRRVDGRKLDELRPISCKVDLFKALHGSSLFQRGQTQVLCSVTFDSPDSMYKSDSIKNMISPSITNFTKNFMLHYEFPGYAINEISRIGGRADRREIGHGALAEKSIYPMIPDDYPFTIRALCEVLESNGSSSMASVCATSMALMDAGVPIKKSVCGVAMGIVTKFDEKNENIIDYKILTDISGFEDYHGDMDFKIAGTETGITAIQADFKISGLPFKIIKEIIEKSQDARIKILNLMKREISKPRQNKKENHPVIKNLTIPLEQRGKFLGTGAINLKRIYSKTGVSIAQNDDSIFNMFAPNQNSLNEAEEMINSILTKEKEPTLEFGGVYSAKIVEIVPNGLMVKLYPNMKPALLPNSQLDGKKIIHGSATEYKIDQEIQVKFFGRDPADGRMRISRKALFKTSAPAKDLLNKK